MAQSPSCYLQMRNASGIADIPPSLTLNGNGRIKKLLSLELIPRMVSHEAAGLLPSEMAPREHP